MARQSFVERCENLQRVVVVSLAREKTSVALHHAQRGRIELVGALEALGGLLLLAGEVEDQRGMQILEDGVPIRAGELVDGVDRMLRLVRVRHRPGRQQRRRQVGDRPADRLGELAARGRILLLLDRTHPEDEPRDAIVLVDLQNALGEPDRLVDLAIGQHRQEGAVEQLVVAGIAAQRGAVIGRGRGGVALTTGVPGGEIAARRRGPRKAIARLRLRLRASGEHSRPSYSECASAATAARRKAGEEITARRLHLADERPRRGRVEQNGEWPVWTRPARTPLIGHVHRL